MMTPLRHLACFAVLALATPGALANDDPVVAAARKREEATKILVVEVRSTDFLAKRSAAEQNAPPEKPTSESLHRFVIDDEKLRVEWNYTEPSGAQPPLNLRTVTVWDGSLRKCLQCQEPREPNRFLATTSRDQRLRFGILPLPLAITFRGLNRGMNGYRVDEMKPTGATETIDGQVCREYTFQPGNLGAILWFDPESDFVLRRLVIKYDGKVGRQYDIRYRELRGLGSAPVGWTFLLYELDGGIRLRTEVEILKTEFNVPLAAEQFDVAFPPGSEFHNEGDRNTYEVQPDGSLRVTHENGVPVSTEAPGPLWHVRNRWPSYAVPGVILLVTVAVFAVRTIRKKPK